MEFEFTAVLGAQLRVLRERSKLSHGEVARRLGLMGTNVKSWIGEPEAGHIKQPQIGTIVLYVKAVGARMAEFFDQFDVMDIVDVDERRPVRPAAFTQLLGSV